MDTSSHAHESQYESSDSPLAASFDEAFLTFSQNKLLEHEKLLYYPVNQRFKIQKEIMGSRSLTNNYTINYTLTSNNFDLQYLSDRPSPVSATYMKPLKDISGVCSTSGKLSHQLGVGGCFDFLPPSIPCTKMVRSWNPMVRLPVVPSFQDIWYQLHFKSNNFNASAVFPLFGFFKCSATFRLPSPLTTIAKVPLNVSFMTVPATGTLELLLATKNYKNSKFTSNSGSSTSWFCHLSNQFDDVTARIGRKNLSSYLGYLTDKKSEKRFTTRYPAFPVQDLSASDAMSVNGRLSNFWTGNRVLRSWGGKYSVCASFYLNKIKSFIYLRGCFQFLQIVSPTRTNEFKYKTMFKCFHKNFHRNLWLKFGFGYELKYVNGTSTARKVVSAEVFS
jgi:hypothetical protein